VAPGRTGSLQRLEIAPGVIASAINTVSPRLSINLRAMWDAANNSWNQWVLNYTQSKQLDLLKGLGFESPSWEDLSYLLLGLIVLVALAGAAWTLWDRRQHDPWLRLLERVRHRLGEVGVELPVTAPPREIATLVTRQFGESGQALADWLLKLEAQRYARTPASTVHELRREFRTVAWPA
jgi:hypothetical protein